MSQMKLKIKKINKNLKFLKCLFNDKEEYREINTIRSYKHEFFTECMKKLALSYKDEKIY